MPFSAKLILTILTGGLVGGGVFLWSAHGQSVYAAYLSGVAMGCL
ncbi:MAG: hypothetical protein AAF468_13880 [Pseudomonadota bacterium]